MNIQPRALVTGVLLIIVCAMLIVAACFKAVNGSTPSVLFLGAFAWYSLYQSTVSLVCFIWSKGIKL